MGLTTGKDRAHGPWSPPCPVAIIDRMAVDRPLLAGVLADIQTLTVEPAPRLEEVEETLTDGYACALELGMERLRLQRRLEQRAGVLAERPGSDSVAEISGLARGVAEADDELAGLRAALVLLKETAARIR